MARILVVDDDEDIRAALIDFFRIISHEVMAVASGEEAIEKVRHRRFDVVVTDLRMPDTDGLSTIAALRDLDAALRFVVTTGYATPSIEAECLAAGAAQVLCKPFDLEEIQRVVETLTCGVSR
jgi:CheY-like chemotaxis protein